MLVLLWGRGGERPLTIVADELHRLGVPSCLIDQRDILDTEVDLDVGNGVCGSIRARNARIDLNSVTALYLRPYDSRQLPNVANAGPSSAAWRHAVDLDDALSCWSEITPALVVNRLSAMATNSSKPYQLDLIRQLGFSIPETLLTTDPRAAQEFWERHGTVVYKSVSAVRSRVSRLRPEHLHRLADVSSCPTQFQQYIAGRDHRVHVVGDEIFPSQIRCDADDYRYAGQHPVSIRPCTLPRDLEDRCRQLAASLGLLVAGIDLRLSEEGEWFCFEVNPSPAFTYYEDSTGQPIARSIARLLSSGTQNLEQDSTLLEVQPVL